MKDFIFCVLIAIAVRLFLREPQVDETTKER